MQPSWFDRVGVCILYTHLGKVDNPAIPLNEDAVKGFCRLAEKFQSEEILVSTTHRILQYLTIRNQIEYHAETRKDVLVITIDSIEDPAKGTRIPDHKELQGITFEIQGNRKVELLLTDRKTILDSKNEYCNGKTYVSILWNALAFPES